MQQRKYFIEIAKELNITKAAEKLYVSQQNLSLYLKKLEEYYGVTLLQRKPRMLLTPAGKALLEAYLKMDGIEKTVYSEINDIIKGAKGSITIGIYSSRSTLLLPRVIGAFLERYPYISFCVNDGVTNQFEEDLLKGAIDVYVGLRPEKKDAFETHRLSQEKLYLAISNGMIRRCLGEEPENFRERYGNGISLKDCENLPFIMQNDESRIAKLIGKYVEENNLKIWVRAKSNNGDLRLELAQKGLGVAFCAQMRIKTVEQLNGNREDDEFLNVFPASNFKDAFDTYLVYRKLEYMPEYFQYFVDLALEYFQDKIL